MTGGQHSGLDDLEAILSEPSPVFSGQQSSEGQTTSEARPDHRPAEPGNAKVNETIHLAELVEMTP